MATMHLPAIDPFLRRTVHLQLCGSVTDFEVGSKCVQPSDDRFICHRHLDTPVVVQEWNRAFAINDSGDVGPNGYIIRDGECGTTVWRGRIRESSFQESSKGSLIHVSFGSDLSDRDPSEDARVGNVEILLGPLFHVATGPRSVPPNGSTRLTTEPLTRDAHERNATVSAGRVESAVTHSYYCTQPGGKPL